MLAILKSVAPILAAAGIVCIALTAFALESNQAILGLVGSIIIVFIVQNLAICITTLQTYRISLKVEKNHSDTGDNPLRLLHSYVVVHVAIVAALFGPLALITSSSAAGLGPTQLILSSGGAFFISEVAFLFPTWLAARSSIRNFLEPSYFGKKGPAPFGTLTVVLTLTVVVSSLLTALGLCIESERLVKRTTTAWAIDAYQQSLETALSTGALETEIDTLSFFTKFDRAKPFTYRPGDNTQRGIDTSDLRSLYQAQKKGPKTTAVNKQTNTGLVWTPSDQSKTINGFRILLDEKSRFYSLTIWLLFVAVFTGILIAIRYSAWIKHSLEYIAHRFDALPDQDISNTRPRLPSEVQAVDQGLKQLKSRFVSMRAGQRESIFSGRKARELKAQFFANISHDLRSPLNSVIGFTDLLLKGLEGELTKDQEQTVLRIAEEAEKLMILIAEILETSKLDAGRLELDRAWVPSVEVFTECTSAARKLVVTRPIILESKLQPGLPPVYIDNERIQQALISLLARAINAVGQGTVKLRASLEREKGDRGRFLRVDIIDSDRSISLEKRGQLAKAFRSMDSTTSRSDAGGLGLGIAFARDVVQLHGGELEISAEKSGPIFSVVLPLDEPTSTD